MIVLCSGVDRLETEGWVLSVKCSGFIPTSYKWSLPMVRKFYSRVTFPGDQWYLRDTVLPDGKKTFSFKSFLAANVEK